MKFWFDTLRSRLLLTFITYVLYMLLYFLTDEVMRDFYLEKHPVWDYVVDILTTLVCVFFFVQLSICYSKVIYRRFMSLAHPYRSRLYSSSDSRYLPHYTNGNASKTYPKSSHDKFKTVSELPDEIL